MPCLPLHVPHFALHASPRTTYLSSHYLPRLTLPASPQTLHCHIPTDHGYWTLNMLITQRHMFSLKDANAAIENAPATMWADGVAPPPIHKHVLKGAQNGKPKKGGKLRYKAAEMRKLALARYRRPRMHRLLSTLHLRLASAHMHLRTCIYAWHPHTCIDALHLCTCIYTHASMHMHLCLASTHMHLRLASMHMHLHTCIYVHASMHMPWHMHLHLASTPCIL